MCGNGSAAAYSLAATSRSAPQARQVDERSGRSWRAYAMPRAARRPASTRRSSGDGLALHSANLERGSAWVPSDSRTQASGRDRPASRPTPRVGVLVVAYNAASTLAARPSAPARVVRPDRRPRDGLRRREHRRHLRRSVSRSRSPRALPITVVTPRAQPRLRRQPEGRLRVGDRARPRRRRAAARRRPVRPRGDRAPRRAARLRHGRRGLRLADDGQGRGPRGRHADLQVRRQPDPHHLPEPPHRSPT